jgi:NADPH:quinone reductase-like Zn-dependent oxidoreductase
MAIPTRPTTPILKRHQEGMLIESSGSKAKPKRFDFLKELFEAGKVVPVIDRWYPLSETAEAIRYLEAGHARGKVVITVTYHE